MRNRLVILIAVNVVLVGATIILLRVWMADQSSDAVVAAAPVEEKSVQVLVATENLNTGLMLQKHHWRWQDWPEDGVSKSYVSYDPEDEEVDTDTLEQTYVGSVVRYGIPEGQPMMSGAVVKPGDKGFFAAILEPGTRAISISITAASSSAGLILPGDRVDVIMAHRFKVEDGEGNKGDHRVAETILQNIRTLAIDQRVASSGDEGQVGKTATLQVTPRQAERLTLAQDMGSLSLSLRGIDEQDKPQGLRRTATWDYNASLALQAMMNPNKEKDVPVVIRGGKTGQ